MFGSITRELIVFGSITRELICLQHVVRVISRRPLRKERRWNSSREEEMELFKRGGDGTLQERRRWNSSREEEMELFNNPEVTRHGRGRVWVGG